MKTPAFYTAPPAFIAPPSIKDTIAGIWGFAVRPAPPQRKQNVLETKLPLIFQLAFIELLLQTLLFIALAVLYNIFGLNHLNDALVRNLAADLSFLPIFVTVVLLAPAMEEIVFRLPLVYSRTYLLVATVAFLLSIGPVAAYMLGIPLLHYALAAILLLGFTGWFLASRERSAALQQYWEKHLGWVFYTSTAIFAFLHLLNPQEGTLPFTLLLLFMLHKFLGGFFLGYTRLRLGLAWSVALHMFNNLVALLVLYGYWTHV